MLSASMGANRRASGTASAGGTIESTNAAPSTSAASSLKTVSPWRRARSAVLALRPTSEVRTSAPFSRSLPPTAAPISPAAITTMIGLMGALLGRLPVAVGLVLGAKHAGGALDVLTLRGVLDLRQHREHRTHVGDAREGHRAVQRADRRERVAEVLEREERRL